MLTPTPNPWETTEKSDIISIGQYSLYVSTSGPPRTPGEPVLVFFTGGGAPTELYVRLQHYTGQFARCYFYDRAGYGRSEWTGSHASNEQTETLPKIYAKDSAKDLHTLLRRIHVRPPYILAGHSYGGLVARTYFAEYPSDVAGIALLEAASELLYQCFSPIPPPAFDRVAGAVDPTELTHLRRESGMSDKEWDAAVAAVAQTMPAADLEDNHESGLFLARNRQIDRGAMGSRPLLVMRSDMASYFRLWLEEAIREGYGTVEDREAAGNWLESLELLADQVFMAQLRLSKNAAFECWGDAGHDFPVRFPERTAILLKEFIRKI